MSEKRFTEMWHYIEVQLPHGFLRDDLLKFKEVHVQLEAENERRKEYIENYHAEDYVLWCREQEQE